MKKGFYAAVMASVVLGAASVAFAGAYGEAEEPEEIPAPAPAVAPEPEPEPPVVMHEWAGFWTDAETTRGLRVEIGSVYAAEYHPSSVGDTQAVNVYANLSYGTELFEVGVALPPYLYWQQDTIGDADDFGDMRIWGKVLPFRGDNFAAGGGLVVSAPTGDHGAGTDEWGFEPFLTGQVMAGEVSIRLSAGYEVFTAPDNLPSDVYDNSELILAALYPVAENVVLRGELTHNHIMDSDADPTNFYPGVDVTFPLGSVELQLRPTLGIGLTEAPDWQVGLGIAVSAPGV